MKPGEPTDSGKIQMTANGISVCYKDHDHWEGDCVREHYVHVNLTEELQGAEGYFGDIHAQAMSWRAVNELVHDLGLQSFIDSHPVIEDRSGKGLALAFIRSLSSQQQIFLIDTCRVLCETLGRERARTVWQTGALQGLSDTCTILCEALEGEGEVEVAARGRAALEIAKPFLPKE